MVEIRYGGKLLNQISLQDNRCAKIRRLWITSRLEIGDSKEKSRQFYNLRFSRYASGERQIKKMKCYRYTKQVKKVTENIISTQSNESFCRLVLISGNVTSLALVGSKHNKEDGDRWAKLKLLCVEFKKSGVDVAALQETRINSTEIGGIIVLDDYVFYFCNCAPKSLYGVGIVISKSCSFSDYKWFYVCPRIIWCLCTFNNARLAIFCAYAPTDCSDDIVKEDYFLLLEAQIKLVPTGTKIIFLTDANGRIGIDTDNIWKDANVRGQYGSLIDQNSNGLLLLSFCSTYKLLVADSLYERPNNDYGTWKHALDYDKNEYKYAQDHILISQSIRHWVVDCTVKPELDLMSDHRPVMITLWCPKGGLTGSNKSNKRQKKIITARELRQKLQFHLLRTDANKLQYRDLLGECLDEELNKIKYEVLNSSRDISVIYDEVETALFNGVDCCMPVVVVQKHHNQHHNDWFDENNVQIKNLLEKKRLSRMKMSANPLSVECIAVYRRCVADVQRECRIMKDKFWERIADKLDLLFQSGTDVSAFSASMKIVYSNEKRAVTSDSPTDENEEILFKLDGVGLTSSFDEYLNRWVEHFQLLLNQVTTVDIEDMGLAGLLPSPMPIQLILGVIFTEEEVRKGIGDMKLDTAGGMDRLQTEMFSLAASVELVPIITSLFNKSLKQGMVPQQWKDVIITILHKSGDKRICDNFRGISLINVIGKILERVIQNRMVIYCENTPGILPTSQFGFRAGRSTQDCMFMSRMISSSAREMNLPLYKCFIDLTKAYDKVNRELLWHILKLRGFPPNLIALIKSLLVGSRAFVRVNGILAEPFELLCGLKQGSVFSALLFNIFFGAIIEIFHEIVSKNGGGVALAVSFEEKHFCQPHKKDKMYKYDMISVIEILFADDAELLSMSVESLQFMVTTFANVAKAYGQLVSVKKSKVLVCEKTLSFPIGPRLKDGRFFFIIVNPPEIFVDGKVLEVVHNFKYVGGTESGDADMDDEISLRKQLMVVAFTKLAGRLFESKHISLKTKLRMFNSTVIVNGVYGCGCWNTCESHLNELETLQFQFLRRIFRARKKDFISREVIMQRAQAVGVIIMPIGITIRKRRLMYLFHILRQGVSSMLYQVFCSEVLGGQRHQGKPDQSFRHSVLSDLKCFKLPLERSRLLAVSSDINNSRRIVDLGAQCCLEEWLAGRASTKAKNDALTDKKNGSSYSRDCSWTCLNIKTGILRWRI